MSERRKISLEEIFNKHLASRTKLEVDYDDYEFIKRAMYEACKQVLELAAENAEVNSTETSDDSSGFISEVNKQSILDTINQVE